MREFSLYCLDGLVSSIGDSFRCCCFSFAITNLGFTDEPVRVEASKEHILIRKKIYLCGLRNECFLREDQVYYGISFRCVDSHHPVSHPKSIERAKKINNVRAFNPTLSPFWRRLTLAPQMYDPWFSNCSPMIAIISSNQSSSNFVLLLCLSTAKIQRPPLTFIGDSHIGLMPSLKR